MQPADRSSLIALPLIVVVGVLFALAGGSALFTLLIALIFVVVMVAVIVGMDLLFFRGRLWERLMANVGVVLVFVAFYLRFLKK